MLNDWFEYEIMKIRSEEENCIIEMYNVILTKTIGKRHKSNLLHAGAKLDWVVVNIMDGGMLAQTSKGSIQSHDLFGEMKVFKKLHREKRASERRQRFFPTQ